jgi:hypothetical protein
MKNLTIQIIILIFLILFPSVSFSQTFKCEFVSEKFKGGLSYSGSCSGDPVLSNETLSRMGKRNEFCKTSTSSPLLYTEYIDYVVDLDNKTIKYIENMGSGVTEVKSFSNKRSFDILSVNPFTQITITEKLEQIQTTSYLVTYKSKIGKIFKREEFYSLYIPNNGKSIVSSYHQSQDTRKGTYSMVKMLFGKCVNTSK